MGRGTGRALLLPTTKLRVGREGHLNSSPFLPPEQLISRRTWSIHQLCRSGGPLNLRPVLLIFKGPPVLQLYGRLHAPTDQLFG